MKICRRKFHLATAAVAFIGVLSFLPITPASAGTHEAPSFQSAPSEVGDNGAPFQLTADPGHFQKTSRSDGSAADSTLTGYTFQLDAIPSTSVYNRVQVRKSGESYYSVVVRSTEGKDSYIQLEKVTNGTTEVLQGAKVNGLKTGTDYRLELEAAGKDKATLSARVYEASSSAPQWQVTATDEKSPFAPSSEIGVTAYVGKGSSTPVTTTVSNLTSADTAASTAQQTNQQNAADGHVEGWGDPVFNDDFNDFSQTKNKWNIEDNTYVGYDWGEIKADNVNVRDGNLVIHTERLKEPISHKKGDIDKDGNIIKQRWYSTGSLQTKNGKFSQEYGRFELRAKLPTIKGHSRGIWPAFWMRPDNADTNEGEIDILEAYGTPAESHEDDHIDLLTQSTATLHYVQPDKHPGQKQKHPNEKAITPAGIDVNDGQFHTWTVEWTPEKITFFVDGQNYLDVDKSNDPRWKTLFGSGDKYNLRLNTQVGSGYWGEPNAEQTADRTEFVIDYVRAWKYQGQS